MTHEDEPQTEPADSAISCLQVCTYIAASGALLGLFVVFLLWLVQLV